MQPKYSEIVSQNQSFASCKAAPHAYIEALRPITSRVRTDATAMWLPNPKTGKLEVNWTHQALSDQRLAEHLDGTGSPRGVCPIRAGESTTRLALLDIDSHKGEVSWDDMSYQAQALIDVLERRGLAMHPFRSSGGNGVHLIALWEEPQDAYSVRMALREVLGLLGYKDGAKGLREKAIEVFPKQDSVAADKFGNQFFLPLARKSVPLDNGPFGLEPLPREAVVDIEWRMSTPVPVLQKPEPKAPFALAAPVDLAEIRKMLFSVPNDPIDGPDYEGWRNVVFAVHAGTNGAAEGLEMLSEWSQQNTTVWEMDPTHLANRVWPYIDSTREGAITINTLKSLAREHGWQEDHSVGFAEVIQPVAVAGEDVLEPLPDFERDTKTGKIFATVGNLIKAIRRSDICGSNVAFDDFHAELMLAPHDKPAEWRQFGDADYVWMRERLEGGNFMRIGTEDLKAVVFAIAQEKRFDSAIEWAGGLKWDGAKRCESFLRRYLGCEDTPYTRAVSLYMWSALAGRVMKPGVKADMVPIFVGAQGVGKSSTVIAMSPSIDFHCEVSFHESEDNLARKMRGKVIAEIGELRGMQTKDLEGIKAFITRTHEKWTPKYKEFTTQFPRRLVFIGTTNQEQFLADDTGNRRWLPVSVGVAGAVDRAAIEADRDQLWAEGCLLFAEQGVMWRDAETLARVVHAKHEMSDAWEPIVARWLDTPEYETARTPRDAEFLVSAHVLMGALGFDARSLGRREEMRISSVLRALGYERRQSRIDGVRGWRFWRTGAGSVTTVTTCHDLLCPR